MSNTPNIALPYIVAAQAQKHVTHNEAIRALDALVQLSVLDRDLAAPPVAPLDGARYIVAGSPTGAWAGQTGRIAAWQDGAWMFYPPRDGWVAWVADESKLCAWNGTAWVVAGGSGVNPVALVGVNTTADSTNRLAVAAANSLFSHDGTDHRLKINKAAAANTASIVYQDAFSGRAEFGLTGDDDFHLKVSADGAVWKDAMLIDRASGRVSFPYGGVVATTSVSVTIRVPEDAATIQAAIDALSAYRFAGAAQGIVDIAPGALTLSASLTCRHPQPAAILIRGRTAATLPTKASFVATKATDEAMLRTKWPTVVQCPAVKPLTLDQSCSGLTLQDILFVQTSGSTIGVEIKAAGVLNMVRVGLHGFSYGALVNSGGFLIDTNCVYSWCSVHSIVASGGDMRSTGPLSMYPATSHIYGESGARVDASNLIGVASVIGIQLYTSTFKLFAPELGNASAYAIYATAGSSGLAYNIAILGTGIAQNVLVSNMSFLQQVGPHTGAPAFSPAIGVVANANSLIA